jgi:acetyl-CoA carboxylase biotin carboxyl carrier protein
MSKGTPPIDTALIRELAGLLDETGLTEIEVEQLGVRVRVSRAGGAHVQAAPLAQAPGAAVAAPQPSPAPLPLNEAADPSRHPGVLKSPMVGTAYRASSPDAAPFVEIGSEVRQGQTVLIIEAMKTMNQIVAPRSGRIAHILVADGQPVEYDEPLLVIE